jgi:hypothetical protein
MSGVHINLIVGNRDRERADNQVETALEHYPPPTKKEHASDDIIGAWESLAEDLKQIEEVETAQP